MKKEKNTKQIENELDDFNLNIELNEFNLENSDFIII